VAHRLENFQCIQYSGSHTIGPANTGRSTLLMANRFRDLRRSTLSWCRRTRISASNAAHSPPYGFPQTPPVVIVHAVTEFIGEYLLRHPVKVWRDPSDRISALRIVTLMCLFAPLSKAIYDSDGIRFDARPITELIHRTGDWALIFLLITLAVRPLSRILRFNQLLDVRRMIGVGAFAYAAAHFTLYIVDLMFDWREIASEIVHRNRLTLGFVALLGLTALALTSTNGMVRRLGIRRWQRLHQAIYLIGVLVLIHYFLRFKLIESTPTFATGLFRLADRLSVARLVVQDRQRAANVDVARAERYGCRADVHRRGDCARHPSQRLAAESATECVRLRSDPAWLARARRGPHSGGARFRVRALCQAAPRGASGRARARGSFVLIIRHPSDRLATLDISPRLSLCLGMICGLSPS
jgi:DMSO/TMAO reductase YedYZ heme-binding membrane subunit